MRILLTGATGFIGRHLAEALEAAGHEVIEARRDCRSEHVAPADHWPRCTQARQCVSADYTRDLQVRDWLPKLAGVQAVVNAVGILRERGAQTFLRIHAQAPQALFSACASAGVRRVVQISALGADTGATRYFASKRAADDHLASLPLDWTIVQPALVYGSGGTSARLFTMLASLPLVPLPGGGSQCVQPIHVDDLIAAIVRLLEDEHASRRRIALVGPEPLGLREFLQRLRVAMGLRPGPYLSVPMWLVRIGARVAGLSPRSLLDSESLTMLESGNTADPAATRALLGGEPRPADAFVDAPSRRTTLLEAQLLWLLPMLRASLAAVWIWSGLVSFGLYPQAASYELLARTGLPAHLQPPALYAAATLDLAFGLATLLLTRRRLLWLAQIATILAYTLVISVRLPEFWLHPYGPVLKNLPMLAAIYLLYRLEASRP